MRPGRQRLTEGEHLAKVARALGAKRRAASGSPRLRTEGSGQLAAALDRLDLIDECRCLVRPRIAGHGPTPYEGGLFDAQRLALVSAKPRHSGAVAMHHRRALIPK